MKSDISTKLVYNYGVPAPKQCSVEVHIVRRMQTHGVLKQYPNIINETDNTKPLSPVISNHSDVLLSISQVNLKIKRFTLSGTSSATTHSEQDANLASIPLFDSSCQSIHKYSKKLCHGRCDMSQDDNEVDQADSKLRTCSKDSFVLNKPEFPAQNWRRRIRYVPCTLH